MDPAAMRLLIGVATGGRPTRAFVDALSALQLPASVTRSDRAVWTGNFLPAQREMIARDAVRVGADYVAMLDDDVVAPPDALVRLLEILERDPGVGVAGTACGSGDEPPFDVADVSFGCVVVRVAALRALEPPYFAARVQVDPGTRTVRLSDAASLLCERLRDAGFRTVRHAGVRAGRSKDHPADVGGRDLRRTMPPPGEPGSSRVEGLQEAMPLTLLFASGDARETPA